MGAGAGVTASAGSMSAEIFFIYFALMEIDGAGQRMGLAF